MRFLIPLSLLVFLNTILTTASPPNRSTPGPPAFFLAGDSTTSAQNCCGGGWGNGFLSTLHNGALGSNFGRNGATTVSYVEDGEWADVIESVSRYSKAGYTPYVTIAFGHNDLRVIDLDQYTANIRALALAVQSAGGYPVLVTPLSKRNYNSSHLIPEADLLPQRLAVLAVAASLAPGSAFAVDLNRHSMTYLNRIRQDDSQLYSLVPGDDTHLNAAGSLVFGNLVSGLVVQEVGRRCGFEMGEWTWPNGTIWKAIMKGEFILPTV